MSNQSSSRRSPVWSILDTDLYKLTMQQAVLKHFPDESVTYRFTNRSPSMQFTREAFEFAKAAIQELSAIQLQPSEAEWLSQTCPFFSPSYLDYLQQFRFRPLEQVSIEFLPSEGDQNQGQISLEAKGKWPEAILYEVPLMSIISEAYFLLVDTDWNYDGQEALAYSKGKDLFQDGIVLSEFGTRRRRSYKTQEIVVRSLAKANDEIYRESPGRLAGTSNPHFAMKFGLTPIGTVAHEWIMGIAAMKGYEQANILANRYWEDVYPADTAKVMLIALPDTFSTSAYFRDLAQDPEMAKRWRGVRQDSGDPFAFLQTAEGAYKSLGIPPEEKTIIFSDGLDVQKCKDIKVICDKAGFISGFGVGTSLDNDFRKLSSGDRSKPLNIVIKLASISGNPCVKISDELTKNTGDKAVVSEVKKRLGIASG